jgi:hypothetical protein
MSHYTQTIVHRVINYFVMEKVILDGNVSNVKNLLIELVEALPLK